MAENYSQIEKSISYFINQQFPAIYRENGPELVQLVKDYYKFMETQTNQSTYVARRFYDYKDIDTTMKDLLIFFQKKYLSDLQLNENIVPFLVKNILDLYRRKGTKAGIELFFATFYNEYDIDIVYPASKMLKPSNSEWKTGTFLQMFPNNNVFISAESGKQYSYSDLISKNITGSISKAIASVTKINSILINGIYTPIIYLDNVMGKFIKYDDIYTNIDGEIVTFGRLNGSLSEFVVDPSGGPQEKKLPNNTPGDKVDVKSDSGDGGEGIVVTVSTETDSVATYDIINGGFGYTVANTSLIVSDQSIQRAVTDTTVFPYGEVLRDTQGNEGFVVGTNKRSIGVKMTSGTFNNLYAISTVDRSPNIDLKAAGIQRDVSGVPTVASPGTPYPEGNPPDANTHVTAVLSDTQTVSLITDAIQPHLATVLNIADYEVNAPFSGTASPVNLSTTLDNAFDISDVEIGRIAGFTNINPGKGYNFDIFAKAKDDFISRFNKKNQIIRLVNAPDVSFFEVGEIITEAGTSATGSVLTKSDSVGTITVVPNTWSGFNGTSNIIRANGDSYSVAGVSLDYANPDKFGDNAVIDANVDYETGYIESVAINNSGFSYIDGSTGTLVDPDDHTRELAFGTIVADTQGKNKGYWKDYSSHIDGYILNGQETSNNEVITSSFANAISNIVVGVDANTGIADLTNDFETWVTSTASDGFQYADIDADGDIDSYDVDQFTLIANGLEPANADLRARFDNIIHPSLKEQSWYNSAENIIWQVDGTNTEYDLTYSSAGMRIQDSNFYQEYSYQIKSTLDKSRYEKLLKENVHLAGTKMFGDFIYKYENTGTTKQRFIRFFNDDGYGSALDIANTDTLEASVTNFTVDSTYVTADHEPV